jgi:hypothetical protein
VEVTKAVSALVHFPPCRPLPEPPSCDGEYSSSSSSPKKRKERKKKKRRRKEEEKANPAPWPLGRYWQFLLWMFIGLTLNELLLAQIPFLYPAYSKLIGYTGLLVEATLPLPQILANWRSRSCRGFRLSVLAFWLLGDATKMFWFFTSVTEIPWPFKLCGMFQACCDSFLGVQYLMYGSGEGGAPTPKMAQMASWPGNHRMAAGRIPSGRGTPTGRRTPLSEKEI